MIKIVLFDAVGVLFPANTVVGDDLTARFNLSTDALGNMWNGFYRDYMVGEMTTQEFLDRFAATYGIPRTQVTEEIFTESFLRALAPMPGMENILKALKETSKTIAMLSDTTEMFAQARREWVFSEYFDHIFLSFEIGYKKPDRQAFEAVMKYYAAAPEEIFFIDDNQGNVDAARQLGLGATTFINAQSLTTDLRRSGILP